MYERRINFTNQSTVDVRFRVRVGDEDPVSRELPVAVGAFHSFSILSIPKVGLTVQVYPECPTSFQFTVQRPNGCQMVGIADVRDESTIPDVRVQYSDYPGVETCSILIEPVYPLTVRDRWGLRLRPGDMVLYLKDGATYWDRIVQLRSSCYPYGMQYVPRADEERVMSTFPHGVCSSV